MIVYLYIAVFMHCMYETEPVLWHYIVQKIKLDTINAAVLQTYVFNFLPYQSHKYGVDVPVMYCGCSRFNQMAGGSAVAGSSGGQLPGYGQQSVGLGRQSSAGGSGNVQGVNASYIQQQRQFVTIQRQQQQQQMVQQNPLMHRQMSANAQQQQQQQQNSQFGSYPPYR